MTRAAGHDDSGGMDPTTALFLRWRSHGDLDALGRLFDATAPRLLGLGLHLCGNAADAEDALQAAFVVAMQKANTFDGTQPVAPWLAGVLAGEAKNVARREQRRRAAPGAEPAAASGDPVAAAERTELVATLRAHVETLPDEQRQVLLLQLQHGLQPAEIAEVLGVAAGTVRMRLHRGLAALRGVLPASLVAALASGTAVAGEGLAAVRADVLREAVTCTAAAGTGSAAAVATGVGARVVELMAVALLLLGVGVGITWSITEPPVAPPALAWIVPSEVAATADVRGEAARDGADALGAERVAPRLAAPGVLQVRVGGADGARWGPVDRHGVPRFGGGTPVVDVVVEATAGARSGSPPRTGRTDARGRLELGEVEPGEWRVAVVIADDHVASRAVVVRPGERTAVQLDLDVSLVRGRVVDVHGVPVAGAQIRAGARFRYGVASSYLRCAATSALDGTFACAVAAGETGVSAHQRGFGASWSYPVGALGSGDVTLVLGDGVARYVATVQTPDQRPLTGAVVQVQWHHESSCRTADGSLLAPPLGQIAVETAPGTYVVEDLLPGTYLVGAFAPGRDAHTGFEVEAGETERFTFTMVRGVGVTGRVVDGDGVGVAGVLVSLVRGEANQAVHSAGDGSFRFDGIEAGAAELVATRLQSGGCGRASLVVGAEADVVCDVALVESAPVRGRVVDPDGRGLDGYCVTVLQRDAQASATTRSDGSFELWGLSLGSSAVSVRHDGEQRAVHEHHVDALDLAAALVIQLPPSVLPSASIRGRVVDAHGTLVPGAAWNLDEETFGSIVEAEGTFRCERVRAGRHVLVFEAQGHAARRVEVDVGHGATTDMGDVVLARAGELQVRFRRPDGSPWRAQLPMPRLEVAPGEPQPPVLPRHGLDAEGDAVVFLSVPAGRYTVLPPHDDDLGWEPRVVRVRAGEVTSVELATTVGRQVSFVLEDYEMLGSIETATIEVARGDGTVVARGDIGPAKNDVERRLFVPLGAFAVVVRSSAGVTHRGEITTTAALAVRPAFVVRPLPAAR